ncbi:MAG: hypothetical protein HYS26_02540 [Candidatus Kaiserbacteria bacterium]|nr:MAG: hypothetical protein HYS26_02540 [Candidatus Kaiserbacteria bacterium]
MSMSAIRLAIILALIPIGLFDIWGHVDYWSTSVKVLYEYLVVFFVLTVPSTIILLTTAFISVKSEKGWQKIFGVIGLVVGGIQAIISVTQLILLSSY